MHKVRRKCIFLSWNSASFAWLAFSPGSVLVSRRIGTGNYHRKRDGSVQLERYCIDACSEIGYYFFQYFFSLSKVVRHKSLHGLNTLQLGIILSEVSS